MRNGIDSGNHAAALLNILVIDASDFGRACTVAGLEATPEFAVASCASVTDCDHLKTPDLILFQSADTVSAGSALMGQLALAIKRWPNAPMLVVADYTDARQMLATIRAGAQGLLTSSASLVSMHSAIELLVNGMGVYPKGMATLLRQEPTESAAAARRADAVSPLSAGRLNALTRRQQDVLQLLALGLSNKVIAQRLQISESTVKVHIRAIMAQHGASNRTQLVAYFLKGAVDED